MNNENIKILVLDDEINIRRSLQTSLEDEDYDVAVFGDAIKAFDALTKNAFDVAILDIRLDDIDGIQLFRKMRKHNVKVPVIFISGNASLEEAVVTVKEGAYDFLEKPFSTERLLITVQNCLEYYLLKKQLHLMEYQNNDVEFIGSDLKIEQLKRESIKVAKTDTTILIEGESGTGKELIAHMIHKNSMRAEKNFVKVNCSAIPEGLIESELFGHMKGSFTGADSQKKGYFENAHTGSLFLDEIGDMSLSTQAKVLRALQNSEIQKVGSDKAIKIDVRIIAATHKDLREEVKNNTFREDLYYRINVIPLRCPALREHPDDIPYMISYFINDICKKNGMKIKEIDSDCLKALKKYHWPGNVRELKNLVERLVIMSDNRITLADIPNEFTEADQIDINKYSGMPLKDFREIIERDYIITTLKNEKGNISRTAHSLDINRTYLHKKMASFDIQKSDYFD